MNNAPSVARDMILGVERETLELFLQFIRDNYPLADQATLFLEEHTDTTNIVAITNLRDVLSHLTSLLNPNLNASQRNDQLTNVKEHFRRAVLEPYEIAYSARMKKVKDLYEKYVSTLLPSRHRYHSLSSAPSRAEVDARLRRIRDLANSGRLSKGNNEWSKPWEQGVAYYIEAFDELSKLHSELEDYWFKFEVAKNNKASHILHWTAIILPFLFTLLDYKHLWEGAKDLFHWLIHLWR